MADDIVPVRSNIIPPEAQLSDVLDLFKKDLLLNLNCHHVGTIESFDEENQTASVSINYKKTFSRFDPVTKVYVPVLVNYPLLIACPVIVLGGGNCSLTFPIAKGDECLLIFNDRDIDNWFSSGQVGPLRTSRLHSFSDGFALVGIRSLLRRLTTYDMDRASLQWNDGARVAVGETKVLVENQDTTLLERLADLVAAVKAITVTVPATGLVSAAPGLPVTGSATGSVSTASQAALQESLDDIGELLE